jgi:hypothetical protein
MRKKWPALGRSDKKIDFVEETALKLEHVKFQMKLLKLLWSGCEIMISEFRIISFLVFRSVIDILQSTVPPYKYNTLHTDDNDGDSSSQ